MTRFLVLAAILLISSINGIRAPAQVLTLNSPRTFPQIANRTEWEKRTAEIREQVLVSCGLWPSPKKTPLRPKIFGRVQHEDYTIEKAYFQPLPGFYLAGNLYRPLGKHKGPFPGVLVAHGHWKEGRLVDDNEASAPALCINLARAGMVAFSYDMVGFNDTRFPDWPTNKPFYDIHRMFATNRTDELWGISLMGLQTWNSIRALDFLESLPDVDRKRLACTGASGGGTQTFMLGVVDDRLAAQAPVCMVSHTMQGGCSCENAPGLRVQYSNMELAAAAAPRPQILVGATGDWTRSLMEVEGPAIAGIYELLKAKEHLRYVRFDFGHNYNQMSREAVCDWFSRSLARSTSSKSFTEQPHQKEAAENLLVFADRKIPADALTMQQFIEGIRDSRQSRWLASIPKSRSDFGRFKKVLFPAWKHTLQLTEALPQEGTNRDDRPTIVVVASEGEGVADSTWLEALGRKRAVLPIASDGTQAVGNEQTNFFSTYNRTLLQLNCNQIVGNCAQQTKSGKRVILVGQRRAGLWSLLSAPAADVVVADCAASDVHDDEHLLTPGLFCPGIRNIGGFEGAAMLAAPHPLLLHNTGNKFSTDAIRATYRALGASDKLRIESRTLSQQEITDWISRWN